MSEYSERVTAANQRHHARVSCARAECANAQHAALTTYQKLDPAGACSEANAAYRKSVADADRECARSVAESTRIRDQDLDAAYRDHHAAALAGRAEAAP